MLELDYCTLHFWRARGPAKGVVMKPNKEVGRLMNRVEKGEGRTKGGRWEKNVEWNPNERMNEDACGENGRQTGKPASPCASNKHAIHSISHIHHTPDEGQRKVTHAQVISDFNHVARKPCRNSLKLCASNRTSKQVERRARCILARCK